MRPGGGGYRRVQDVGTGPDVVARAATERGVRVADPNLYSESRLEDLAVMPGDENDVDYGLVRARSGLLARASTAWPASFLATYRLDTRIRRSSVMPSTPRSNSA